MPLYSKDPIVEAIFSVSFEPVPDYASKGFEDACKNLFPDYPKATTTNKRPSHHGKVTSDKPHPVCHILERDNLSVHCGVNEFAFHSAAPYKSWDVFFPEAYRCWKEFRKLKSVLRIKQVTLRYINNLPLPIGKKGIRISDYIKSVPTTPGTKNKEAFAHYSMSMLIPHGKMTHSIVYQTIMLDESTDDFVLFLIDNEAHVHVNYPRNKDLTKDVEELRLIKNKTFNDLITNRTKALIK